MAGFVRVSIDVPGLVAAIVAYLNDPRPDRNTYHADVLSDDLEQSTGLSQDLLEAMLIDGVTDADDVTALVTFLTAHGPMPGGAPEAMSLDSPGAR